MFSCKWETRSLESSGMQRRLVMLKWTDVSEVRTVSIMRAMIHRPVYIYHAR
jgi:hypothetical protein